MRLNGEGPRRRIDIIVDCLGVIAVADRCVLPQGHFLLVRRIWVAVSAASDVFEIRWINVPPHGKIRPGWSPAQGYTEAELRHINDQADKSATAALLAEAGRGDLQEWRRKRKRKLEWVKAAFKLAFERGRVSGT